MKNIYFPTVLVVSTTDDAHTLRVLSLLSGEAVPFILDFSKFGIEYTSTIEHSSDGIILQIAGKNGDVFDLSAVSVVWWRRPSPILVERNIGAEQHFAQGERLLFMRSLLAHLKDKCKWYNDFDFQRIIDRKSYQLDLAQKCGLSIPRTCITSSPATARRFLSTPGDFIFKSFSGSEEFWQPTRTYKKEYDEILRHLTYAPVIFQEYINGIFDHRVTYIDGELFAVRFDIGRSEYKVDVRIDTSLIPEKCVIPDSIARKLQDFMRAANLRFGAFDFRERDDGEFVFFEVNPAGQFLYIDDHAETRIAETLAQKLSIKSQVEKKTLTSPIYNTEIPNFSASIPFHAAVPDRISHIYKDMDLSHLLPER